MIESKFLLNSIVETKNKSESEENVDGVGNDLILTGIASTSREPSLYGEVMSREALNQMCEQAVGLPILEGHHGDSFDTVVGVIVDAYIRDDDLHIDFKVLSNHQERISELLSNGVPVGLSIGAQARIDETTQSVTDITLIEVSLTPVPANRVAHNTVQVKNDYYTGTCLHGICNAMIKDKFNNTIMEVNNMSEEENVKLEESIGEETNTPAPEENKGVEVDEPLTVDKVKEMLDERFNEEKQVLIDTVTEEVLVKLKKEKGENDDKILEESIDTEDSVEVESENNEKEKKEPIKESTNINEEQIVESITEKILNSLGEKRDTTSTKTETVLKNESHTEAEPEDKPFTSEEAAKLIINDMNKKDPLARAINTVLKQ